MECGNSGCSRDGAPPLPSPSSSIPRRTLSPHQPHAGVHFGPGGHLLGGGSPPSNLLYIRGTGVHPLLVSRFPAGAFPRDGGSLQGSAVERRLASLAGILFSAFLQGGIAGGCRLVWRAGFSSPDGLVWGPSRRFLASNCVAAGGSRIQGRR